MYYLFYNHEQFRSDLEKHNEQLNCQFKDYFLSHAAPSIDQLQERDEYKFLTNCINDLEYVSWIFGRYSQIKNAHMYFNQIRLYGLMIYTFDQFYTSYDSFDGSALDYIKRVIFPYLDKQKVNYFNKIDQYDFTDTIFFRKKGDSIEAKSFHAYEISFLVFLILKSTGLPSSTIKSHFPQLMYILMGDSEQALEDYKSSFSDEIISITEEIMADIFNVYEKSRVIRKLTTPNGYYNYLKTESNSQVFSFLRHPYGINKQRMDSTWAKLKLTFSDIIDDKVEDWFDAFRREPKRILRE